MILHVKNRGIYQVEYIEIQARPVGTGYLRAVVATMNPSGASIKITPDALPLANLHLALSALANLVRDYHVVYVDPTYDWEPKGTIEDC